MQNLAMGKRLTLAVAAAAVLFVSACSRFDNRGTVDRPFIGIANTTDLSFERIELTDSSTILCGKIRFRPGWWVRISGSSAIVAGGDKYAATAFDGIVPDEEVVMPDSGVLRFTMTFPPIPASVRSIDFTEGTPDGWALWDIDLTGTDSSGKYMAEVPSEVVDMDPDALLPATECRFDTTTVRVHVMGYRPGMGDGIGWAVNTLHGQVASSEEEPCRIDSTGVAEIEFPLSAPAVFFVCEPVRSMATLPSGPTVVAPGETVDIYLNAHFSGMLNMAGRDGVEPDEDAMVTHRVKGTYSGLGAPKASQVLQTRTGTFGDYRMDGDAYTGFLLARYGAVRDSIEADASLSPATRTFLTNNLKVETARAAACAREILLRNYYHVNGRRPDDIYAEIPVSLSPDNVRAVAAVVDFRDPDILLSGSLRYLTGTEFWKEAGVDTGLLDMVRLYADAYREADAKGEVRAALLDSLRALSAPMADEVAAVADAAKARLAALDYSLVTPAPDVPADRFFEAILAPHRGKVVVVDLWNTWCRPCLAALARNEPEKSGDPSSDDIVWIYIASESSPIDRHAAKIRNIRGIHYRVDDERIAALRERFDVDGIPYYILVDRRGEAAGRPDLRDHDAFKRAILDEVAR